MNFMKVKDSSVENSINKKGLYHSKYEAAYTYTFFINRNRKNIRYYYIKKNVAVEAERHPGRLLDLNNIEAKKHPDC